MLATVIAAFAAAAPAQAQWAAPIGLSLPDSYDIEPHVAVDPAGAATVVWADRSAASDMVRARRIAADGTVGAVLDISDPAEGTSDPQVAVDAAGNATVVWRSQLAGGEMVRARRITAAGALEPIMDVSALDNVFSAPRLAAAPSGAVTVVWSVNDSATEIVVQGRRIAADGTLGSIEDLSVVLESINGIDIAVDASGRAAFAWAAYNGTRYVVRERIMDAAGALAPAVTRSAPGEDVRDPDIAFGPAGGDPALTWRREPDDMIRVRSGGTLHDVSASGEQCVTSRLAVGGVGDVTVAWECEESGGAYRAKTRRLAADGTLGPIHDLSGPSDNDPSPELAVDGRGDATIVWRREAGPIYVVQAARMAADGSLGPVEDVSELSEEVEGAQVAAGPIGNAVAVWADYDGTRYEIAAARFTAPQPSPPEPPPLPPPPPPPPPAPAAGVAAAPAPACEGIALRRLSSYTKGQPRAHRRRVEGIGTRLTLSRPGRVQLLAATISYRGRRATLRTTRITASTRRPVLRFRLPARASRALAPGRRVTVRLRLRAAATGCAFARATTLKLATRVIWVRRGAAI
jgi:hypothetical protein